MLRSTTENFPILSVLIHRLSVVEKIAKQTDMFCDIANVSQRELPLPIVGCVKEHFYLLSGFDVFYGVQKSNLDNIECTIHDFDTEVEFLIEHVRLNKNPTVFNPLSLFPLIEFIKTNGVSDEQISGLLQIHNTIYEKIINQNLHSDTIKKLSELYSFLAENLTQPNIPFYAIKLIAQCDLSEQTNAVELMRKLVTAIQVKDTKFIFPSYEELKIQLENPEFYQAKHESVIINPKGDATSTTEIKISLKCW
ncbi:MAG: hypothetical protein HRO68_00490 [Nitrosopumilus sp.]|nr:hypothetical protein [Nitrosopumilus sp.]